MRLVTSATIATMSRSVEKENSGRRRTGALQSHNQVETALPCVDRVSMNERKKGTHSKSASIQSWH